MRKTNARPKSDLWRCSACRTQGRVIEVYVQAFPAGNFGVALCFPCARAIAKAVPLPGEERSKP